MPSDLTTAYAKLRGTLAAETLPCFGAVADHQNAQDVLEHLNRVIAAADEYAKSAVRALRSACTTSIDMSAINVTAEDLNYELSAVASRLAGDAPCEPAHMSDFAQHNTHHAQFGKVA